MLSPTDNIGDIRELGAQFRPSLPYDPKFSSSHKVCLLCEENAPDYPTQKHPTHKRHTLPNSAVDSSKVFSLEKSVQVSEKNSHELYLSGIMGVGDERPFQSHDYRSHNSVTLRKI